ncbi:MAG: hypothetical protein J0H65_03250 [Rhizobiales bacterium]|nr:hypothetical protein [Hyphomicrobiales bacterium]
MSANDLILLILVAAGAFYAGYQVGRLKALAEVGTRHPDDTDQPLPGPLDGPLAEPTAPPSRPRGAPPPVSAGNNGTWADAGGASSGRAPPRRSSKPPPAAAGLMGTGEAENSGRRQK